VRRGAAAVALASLLVAAACGSSGGNAAPDTVAVTTAAGTTSGTTAPGNGGTSGNGGTRAQTTNPSKPAIGKVLDIVPVGGTVGGASAFAGQGVAAQDVISSDPNGKIRFDLGAALPFCQVETDSAVKARPGGAALVEVSKGTVLCRTSGQGQLKTFNAGGSVLQAVDPVFLLTWDGSDVGLRVAQGYVGVRGPNGTVAVGANRQTSYSPGQAPGVGPWDQSELRGELRDTVSSQVAEAQRGVRPPAYPQVGTGSSPALAAAVQRGVLKVLVTSSDGDVGELTTALLQQFLAHGPKVKLDVSATGVDDARASLASGDADLVVSDEIRTRASAPFFTSSGSTWFVTQGPNGGQLVSQIGLFLTAALQARCSTSRTATAAPPGQSCFETTYRQAVGAGSGEYVPLDGMAGYLGLG
jgi:hypothetical protein